MNTVVLPGQEVKYIEDVAAGIDQDGAIEGAGGGWRGEAGPRAGMRRARAGGGAGAIEGAGGYSAGAGAGRRTPGRVLHALEKR